MAWGGESAGESTVESAVEWGVDSDPRVELGLEGKKKKKKRRRERGGEKKKKEILNCNCTVIRGLPFRPIGCHAAFAAQAVRHRKGLPVCCEQLEQLEFLEPANSAFSSTDHTARGELRDLAEGGHEFESPDLQ